MKVKEVSTFDLSAMRISLENEITELRKFMEEVIAQEESLTSDIVVFVSGLLDEKINEYLRLKYNRE